METAVSAHDIALRSATAVFYVPGTDIARIVGMPLVRRKKSMRRLGRQSSRLLTVGGSILSAFIVAMLPAHSEPVTDAAIAAAVEREYFRDAAVTRASWR